MICNYSNIFFYKIQLLLVISLLAFFNNANCQSSDYVLKSTQCKLGCGAEFNYNSKIAIRNDTINIFQSTKTIETIVNQYKILERKEKWRSSNYDGITKYKVIQVSDSSKREIQLALRNGKGTVSILKNGECEITLSVVSK